MMRSLAGLAVAALLVAALTGCSSDEPLAVEFSHSQEHGVQPFVATGAAVDAGLVCPSGTHEMVRMESVEGEEITDADWADMFDGAMETGSIAEMMVFEDWTCDDGSGAFTVALHNRFDFATFEFEGQQDVGNWEITEGTGEYTALAGTGSVTLDWDGAKVIYTGDIPAS